MNKKGVSPLIATVLLISFAVALGAVVMNWAGSLSHGSELCEGASVQIAQANAVKQICYDGQKQQLRATIINGETHVSGVRFTVVGQKGLENIQVDKPMDPDDRKEYVVFYDAATNGLPQQVLIKPVVGEGAGLEVCTEKGVQTNTITAC